MGGAACGIPWHCYRVEVHQHLKMFQEKMIVLEDNSQGVFDLVFCKCLSNICEEDLGGSDKFKLVMCHTKLWQGIVMFHSIRQNLKSHGVLSRRG